MVSRILAETGGSVASCPEAQGMITPQLDSQVEVAHGRLDRFHKMLLKKKDRST